MYADIELILSIIWIIFCSGLGIVAPHYIIMLLFRGTEKANSGVWRLEQSAGWVSKVNKKENPFKFVHVFCFEALLWW